MGLQEVTNGTSKEVVVKGIPEMPGKTAIIEKESPEGVDECVA